MRWPPWSSQASGDRDDNDKGRGSWFPVNNAAIDKPTIDWAAFTEPRTLISTLILTAGILGLTRFHRSYLRRFPDAPSIPISYYRRRSILGKVTSVGDGDNFRIYHTPGGWLAGWEWLPWKRVPKDKKLLRGNTIHIRLAGVDAPELAHFGRPAQPFAREAHDWLTHYLMNRRVRVYLHRPDQYQRAVATVYVRRALNIVPFRRRDVSCEMLKRGLATVYEAKMGAEFGGADMEAAYQKAEKIAKLRARGMWKDLWKGLGQNKTFETPREYKNRFLLEELKNGKEAIGNSHGTGKNGNGKNGKK